METNNILPIFDTEGLVLQCSSLYNITVRKWVILIDDYIFGNKIVKLRTQLKLSQTELAEMVGVTNKAVSKWETGKSKPTTNGIRKLAALFKIDLNELLSMKDEERNMKISKIVITGGPCAGKSSAMSWVQNAFTQIGYTVLFVPETATELITGGVAPWTCGTNAEYQKCQLKLQIEKENIFEQAARTKKIVYCYNECGCSSDVLCFTPVHSKYAAYLYSTLYTDILLTSHTLKIGAESIHLLLRFLFCQQVPYLTLSTVERAIYYFNNERPVRKLNGKPPVLFRTERVA